MGEKAMESDDTLVNSRVRQLAEQKPVTNFLILQLFHSSIGAVSTTLCIEIYVEVEATFGSLESCSPKTCR